jgi:hypothetical protein
VPWAIPASTYVNSEGSLRSQGANYCQPQDRAVDLAERVDRQQHAVSDDPAALYRPKNLTFAASPSCMVDENLTPDEREAVLKAPRNTIAADGFPLSPRIRKLKSALRKLDPTRAAAPQPYPPPKDW